MRIHAPSISNQSIGGGYTFYKNFIKSMLRYEDIELVSEDTPHELLFAFSPTTISGEIIDRAKKNGTKFILRIDGVPEDNRNSGKGTRRLIEYASKADFIIFQTKFIANTVGRILRDNGVTEVPTRVVYNGVDLDIFTPEGPKIAYPGKINILHINYRKDNNKRYEEVVQMYRELWTHRKDVNLLLMGRYPTEWMDYNMGFFNGEAFQRLGVIEDEKYKAQVIRSCDVFFYPSYADPSPNVVLEVMACGVPIIYQSYGGSKELIDSPAWQIGNHSYTHFIEIVEGLDKERTKYIWRSQAENFGLEQMGLNYRNVFDAVMSF